MRTKNHVSIIGIVGKDAELRNTQGGVPYARFSLATSTGGYKKQDGTDVPEVTQWHNITCWRKLAEMVGKYVKKGMKVDVEGMITYNQYQDQQGVQRMGVEIMADDIVLMTKTNDGTQPNTAMQGQQPVNTPSQQYQAQRQPQNGYQQQPPTQGGYQQQPVQQQPQYQQQGDGAAPAPPNNPDDLPF